MNLCYQLARANFVSRGAFQALGGDPDGDTLIDMAHDERKLIKRAAAELNWVTGSPIYTAAKSRLRALRQLVEALENNPGQLPERVAEALIYTSEQWEAALVEEAVESRKHRNGDQ